MTKISVFNCETQSEELRDMTIEEQESLKNTQDSIAKNKAIEAEALSNKAALLVKLGITANEAALLLG